MAETKRGTIIEFRGARFVAMDDEIIDLLSRAAEFEQIGTCSLVTAFNVAVQCGRLTIWMGGR